MPEHWADGPMALLDFETDSPTPDDAHTVTAALIHTRPGQPFVRRSWVAKPTRPIPEGATAVHGYTTERAEAEGDDPARVIAEIHESLTAIWSPDCSLIVYNSPFDLSVLDAELARHHNGKLEIHGPVIDPLLIDRRADKWRKGSRKLAVTCEHYGIALTDAHEAYADALAAGRLAWTLGTRHRKPPPCWPLGRYGPSPDEVQARSVLARGCPRELHDAQISWYRINSLGLADYFRNDPKAVEKINAACDAGETTREEADELIRTLPERADDVERHADGWPLRSRIPASTIP